MDKQGCDSLFRDRLARHEDELHRLYLSLYGGDEHAFEYFLQMLQKYLILKTKEK